MTTRIELKNHCDEPVVIKTSTEEVTLPPQASCFIFDAYFTVKPATAPALEPAPVPVVTAQ